MDLRYIGIFNLFTLLFFIPLALIGKLNWHKEVFSRLSLRKNILIVTLFTLIVTSFSIGQFVFALILFNHEGLMSHLVSLVLTLIGAAFLISCSFIKAEAKVWQRGKHTFFAWGSVLFIFLSLTIYIVENLKNNDLISSIDLIIGYIILLLLVVLSKINLLKINAFQEIKIMLIVAWMNIFLTYNLFSP